MKVLLSAYACEPWSGSEPGSGFRALMAAASKHDVWVLTRENNLPGLERFFEQHSYRPRIHLVGVDLPPIMLRAKKRFGIVGMHVYYDLWQRKAGRQGVALDKTVGFDVVHHATFANYWTRVGVAAVPKPLVWGPVGGAVNTPWRMIGQLGWRGLAGDGGRALGRMVMRVFVPAPRPTVALAQNRETARRVNRGDSVRVLPNALGVQVEPNAAGPRSRSIIVAGRLVPWKGTLLALQAFNRVRDESATMILVGDGPQRTRIEKEIRRLGLGGKASLAGVLPRDELMRRLASAGALLHTAFREEAGWIVSEALSLGTPVVCLDRGGPPILARYWQDTASAVIPPAGPQATASALARALDSYLEDAPPTRERRVMPTVSFTSALLESYEEAVRSGI